MKKVIDARDLECPKPILEAQAAFKDSQVDTIEITVGNLTSRENLKRFSKTNNYSCQVEDLGGDLFKMTISREAGLEAAETPVSVEAVEEEDQKDLGGMTYLILSDELGRGERELGEVLMKGFLYTLSQTEPLPKKLVLLNSAIRLSTVNEETVAHLKDMEARGTEVYSCGTCLNFYNLAEELKVGLIGNMYDVVEAISQTKNKISVG